MTTRCSGLALLAALTAAACSSYNRAPALPTDAGVTADAPVVVADTPAVDAPAVVADTPAVDAPAVDAPDGGAALPYTCERFCQPLYAVPVCAMAAMGCTSMCPGDFRTFPARCDSSFRSLFACIESPGLTPVCMAGTFPYPGCMELNGAARQCAQSGS